MSVLDKFLNAMKINDDEDDAYDEDEQYLDDDDPDYDPDERLGTRVIRRRDEDDLMDDDDEESASGYSGRRGAKSDLSSSRQKTSSARNSSVSSPGSKISPIRSKKRERGEAGMEVCVIKPHTMEDAREITETLLANCTVVLNLEGLELDIAQRLIDFASGSCYAIDGNLQKISNYIFIITPSSVDISGDFQEILSGAFDVPFEKRHS
jgi:cell division inhibitor SepF